jgi:hypothetical protein
MAQREEGLIQSCVGLDVKTSDDFTDNNAAAAEVPNKWLKIIDANGNMKRAKRFVCKKFIVIVFEQFFLHIICRSVACVVNSIFKNIYINTDFKEKRVERFGSLQDVERIKTTCANLSISLNKEDIVLNQKQKNILKKIKIVGACNDNNGNFTTKIYFIIGPEKHYFLEESIDIFMLFVMSHGGDNGVIHTDYLKSGSQPNGRSVFNNFDDFEDYTIDDIFKAINCNPNLTNSLKIIVIQV